jgi:hypothetical protein
MPYKDPEAKRRYMSRCYEQKIKTGEIPCTACRKGSYGLTSSCANKTRVSRSAILAPKSSISQPISPSQALLASTRTGLNPFFPFKRERKQPVQTGGAEYKERIPREFTGLGNGVVMRFIKPGEN